MRNASVELVVIGNRQETAAARFNFACERGDVSLAHLRSKMTEATKREEVVSRIVWHARKRRITGDDVIQLWPRADVVPESRVLSRHRVDGIDAPRIELGDCLGPCTAARTDLNNHAVRCDIRLDAGEISQIERTVPTKDAIARAAHRIPRIALVISAAPYSRKARKE